MNQELLNKYIAGDATPEEKEEVARWLDADTYPWGISVGRYGLPALSWQRLQPFLFLLSLLFIHS